ncbi:MAG: NAD-dependent epimerase/dehydratase family protein [Myxococcales bacterium]|nr:NAD-dependent epimerase/dehydratase family protein [Myxococcales bacterium]
MSPRSDASFPTSGKVLVTGAAGLVGANIVRRLLDDGHDVRAMVLPGADNRGVEGLEVEVVEADLRDPDAVRRAVKGCARVFHVGAKVSTTSPSAEEERAIWDTNVLGTRNVMRSALAADVERVVLTGSFSAIGFDPDTPSRPAHEGMPFFPFTDWLPYARTKVLAEHETLKAVIDGLDAVIAVATGVIGPYDYLPSRQGRALIDTVHGKMRAYIPGGSEFVSTADLTEGHMLAMARGRKGQRYLFSTAYMSLDDLLDHFCAVSGAKRPRLRLPPKLVAGVSSLYSRPLARYFPKVPQRLTPGMVHIVSMHRRGDCTKAKEELGYQPTDIREAIRETYEFFLREGMIDRERIRA